jgi:serine-type D-Ala-D-Ala carboxypeptidase/endopeptidase (penicillin-binding protein 4)
MKGIPLYIFLSSVIFLNACSSRQFIAKTANRELFQQENLKSAHFGISLYDVSASSFLYDYQGEKYFTPASNTKLFSLYAGMKYLGDSLVGIRYIERDTGVLVLPTGDPTLLHRDFIKQPVVDFLKNKNIYISDYNWKEQALGAGWSWDDYNDDYMVERSPLPVYGNIVQWMQSQQPDSSLSSYSVPDINWKVDFADSSGKNFFVKRNVFENVFIITQGKEKYRQQDVPFVTKGLASAIELLKDTISKNIFLIHQNIYPFPNDGRVLMIDRRISTKDEKNPSAGKNSDAAKPASPWDQLDLLAGPGRHVIHSQPVDSLFRPMMHRSDNFFAEQTLLMVSNEQLGYMKDAPIIDSLLQSDLKDLPQKPVWVDGSGLSRYNLFSPDDFVWLLNQMKNEFGLERMKRLLPTGGTGTLGNYYKQDSGHIYAKTGSLSGVICLSGYLITQKNRLLIFSVLVNNYTGRGQALRRAIESFLETVISTY